MNTKQHQDLLDELNELRARVEAMTVDKKVRPIEIVSGVVDGGPAMVVANQSSVLGSQGMVVSVGGDKSVRNIALTVESDAANGVGIIARGDYGVVGQSEDNVGVMGFGATGVFGLSNDRAGRGIEGHATSESGIGVLASASNAEITALAINDGNIRVMGAGENTPTPVFIHVADELNTRTNQTVIDHPMTNGDPNAILLITRRATLFFTQDDGSLTPPPPRAEPFSVAYSSRANKWLIMQPFGTLLPLGATFNVLVFKV